MCRAEPVEPQAPGGMEVLEEALATAQSAARKASRRATKLAAAAAEPEEVAEAEAEAAKAERKAGKKAAKLQAAKEAQEATNLAESKKAKKRKADETADSDSTEASVSDHKRRKDEEGEAAKPAVQVLGADAYRKAHQIVCYSGCPGPLETFDASAPVLGPLLTKALRAQGYVNPTPIQAQGWPVALEGRDVVAVAKTGSGKTVGFLLPALRRIEERGPQRVSGFTRMSKPTVLVLAPTRELVQQTAGEAEKFAKAVNAKVCVLFGGVPKNEQVGELKRGSDIIIATPGRLLDFCAGDASKGLSPLVSLENVNYLVLDEADRMLDMGFEPDIRKIVEQCKQSGRAEEGGGAPGPLGGTRRQTLFFTATWPKSVQRTARSLTSHDALNVCIGQGAGGDKLSANPMVKQTILMVSQEEKTDKLHEIIAKELQPGETCVLFCSMKATCDRVERQIRSKGSEFGFQPWCRVIHSGREQWERDQSLLEFRQVTAEKGERRGILVATDVAARGLDIPGVAMVIVNDLGRSKRGDDSAVESYVHRIGRTGRAGKTGRAFCFFTPEDNGASELVELLEGGKQEVPSALKELADAEWYKKQRKGKGKGKGKGKFGKGGKGFGKSKGGSKSKSFGGRGAGKSW